MNVTHKMMRNIALISVGLGILPTLVGVFITPTFIANYFSTRGILTEETIQKIQVIRLVEICMGMFIAFFCSIIFLKLIIGTI